jgi:hypothetical protein
MSAFVVNSATLQCAVHAISRHCRSFEGIPIPSDPATPAAVALLTVIGRRLWVMNIQAVASRYSVPPEQTGNFRFDPDLAPTPAQMRGCIECLEYQCDEQGTDKTLHAALESAVEDVRRAIDCEGQYGVLSMDEIPLTAEAEDDRRRLAVIRAGTTATVTPATSALSIG